MALPLVDDSWSARLRRNLAGRRVRTERIVALLRVLADLDDDPARPVPAEAPASLEEILAGPDWFAEAACAAVDPHAFRPEADPQGRALQSLCGRCPAFIACTQWSATHGGELYLFAG